MEIKKSLCVFAISALIALPIAGCGGSPSTNDAGSAETKKPAQAEKAETATSDYAVTIDGCKKGQDYEGKPCVIIDFTFTNNSDDPQSMASATSIEVYQNNVQCDMAVTDTDINADNYMNNVKKGATISCSLAYSVADDSDIEVSVKELVSLSEKPLAEKTFSLS